MIKTKITLALIVLLSACGVEPTSSVQRINGDAGNATSKITTTLTIVSMQKCLGCEILKKDLFEQKVTDSNSNDFNLKTPYYNSVKLDYCLSEAKDVSKCKDQEEQIKMLIPELNLLMFPMVIIHQNKDGKRKVLYASVDSSGPKKDIANSVKTVLDTVLEPAAAEKSLSQKNTQPIVTKREPTQTTPSEPPKAPAQTTETKQDNSLVVSILTILSQLFK